MNEPRTEKELRLRGAEVKSMSRGFVPSSIPSASKQTPAGSISKNHPGAQPVSGHLSSHPSLNPNLPEINLKVHQLPSKALPYPTNCEIHYRPYTFGEIKKISQSKLSIKDGFSLVLSGVECSFDKNQLTMGDLLYIGLLRKLSTVGTSKVMVPYVCQVCSESNKEVFSIDSIEFEELKIPALPICVSFSFGNLEFSPLTVQDFMEILAHGKETDEITMISAQVRNQDSQQVFTAFQNCFGEDALLLDEVDRILFHGVKPISSKCQKCANEVKIELDGGTALLLPFRDSKVPHENRIHFGSQTSHQSS